MSDLPLELLNEPVTDNDNKYRVEMIVSRPRFVFSVWEGGANVSVGGSVIQFTHNTDGAFNKSTTNVSVLTIYDTYGLAITARFLKHISSGWFIQTEFYKLYLVGCTASLGLPVPSDYKMVDETEMLANIYTELIRRDESSYRITLVPVSLPLELVARIVCSVRISKAIAVIVRTNRENERPDLENLAGFYPWRARTSDGMYHCITGMHSCLLERRDDGFSLIVGPEADVRRGNAPSKAVTNSLRVGYGYYKSRNCNPQNAVRKALGILRRAVHNLKPEQLCATTVQLSHDLRVESGFQGLNETALREHLLTLIARCEVYDFGLE